MKKSYPIAYRNIFLFVIWPFKQWLERLLVFRPKIWQKIDQILVQKLIDLIVVEVWYWEEFGWFRCRKTVSLAEWIKENGFGWVDFELVKKYFWGNWLVWENIKTFPRPIVQDIALRDGFVYPLDLVSMVSEMQKK